MANKTWKYCVRALNAAETSGVNDTAESIANILINISKVLEFCETMRETEQQTS